MVLGKVLQRVSLRLAKQPRPTRLMGSGRTALDVQGVDIDDSAA